MYLLFLASAAGIAAITAARSSLAFHLRQTKVLLYMAYPGHVKRDLESSKGHKGWAWFPFQRDACWDPAWETGSKKSLILSVCGVCKLT